MPKKESKISVKKIVNLINNGKTPLGTLISPSSVTEGVMIVRNESKDNPNLLKSLVCFMVDGSPCLASISDVQTYNVYMDRDSKLGRGNLSFIANRGKVPHTEDSDIKFTPLEFLTKLDLTDGKRSQLRASPSIGINIVETDDDILQEFYPFNFPENIAIGRYLNTNLPVPLDVNAIKEVHCGIFGVTGWGKSVLQSYLAATLVRAGCKLLIFDHSGDYAKPGTDVEKIFKKLVKSFKVFKADLIKADNDLLSVKLSDRYFWQTTFNTTASYADNLARAISDRLGENYPDESALSNLNEARFLENVSEALEDVFAGRTLENKQNSFDRKQGRIRDWFTRKIIPYLDRPVNFQDIEDSIKKNQAVVIDLTGDRMTDTEKCLYVYKIGERVLHEAKRIYDKENKRQMNLVVIVDEAHIYVPQKMPESINENTIWVSRSKDIVTEFAKQGRKYGIGLCLADQRITAVDKQAIDFQTYFLGKLQMKGDSNHIREMFGDTAVTGLRLLKKYHFMVVGSASPMEDVTAPIQVFNPKSDLDYVSKLHSK